MNKPKRLTYVDRFGTIQRRQRCSIPGCNRLRRLYSYTVVSGERRWIEDPTCCNHFHDGSVRPDQTQEVKNARRWKQQGLDFDMVRFRKLLELQGDRCAICGRKNKKDRRKFNVDHNHETGAIRGLLCGYCNRALGWFENHASFDVLRAYLDSDVYKKYPELRSLRKR